MDNSNMKEDADPIKRQEEATKLIVWFNHEDKYSQGSFILTILQWCESYLIFTIALNILSLQEMDCKFVFFVFEYFSFEKKFFSRR